MKRNIVILFLSCFVSIVYSNNNQVIALTLDQYDFDSLYVSFGVENKDYVYPGDKLNDTWLFEIPDSVVSKYWGVTFHSKRSTPLAADLAFATIHQKDTSLYVSGTLYWSDADTIQLKGEFVRKNTATFSNPIPRKITTYNYVISSDDPEVALSIYASCSFFGRFKNYEGKEITDQQYLQNYKDTISKYPDSRSLMYATYGGVRMYNDISELEEVFNCFSRHAKETYYGQKIGRYIRLFHSPFGNMTLTNSLTGKKEAVALPDRPTMIIFSASWCRPCHRLVPVLKKIYKKTFSKIDMVYISIDEPQTEKEWAKFLEKEKIPWRSLSAGKQVKEVRDGYSVFTIPQVLYVDMERGTTEKLDLMKENDVKKIIDYGLKEQ